MSRVHGSPGVNIEDYYNSTKGLVTPRYSGIESKYDKRSGKDEEGKSSNFSLSLPFSLDLNGS